MKKNLYSELKAIQDKCLEGDDCTGCKYEVGKYNNLCQWEIIFNNGSPCEWELDSLLNEVKK